mgnify:CR=1 FL=1
MERIFDCFPVSVSTELEQFTAMTCCLIPAKFHIHYLSVAKSKINLKDLGKKVFSGAKDKVNSEVKDFIKKKLVKKGAKKAAKKVREV